MKLTKNHFLISILCLGVCIGNINAVARETPTDTFLIRKIGVMRHYGSSTSYGITVKQLVTALNSKNIQTEWAKDADTWVLKLTTSEKASGKINYTAFVFKYENPDMATITRFIDGTKEVKPTFVGAAVDQLLIPISMNIEGSNPPHKDKITEQFLIDSKEHQEKLYSSLDGDFSDGKHSLKVKTLGSNKIKLDLTCDHNPELPPSNKVEISFSGELILKYQKSQNTSSKNGVYFGTFSVPGCKEEIIFDNLDLGKNNSDITAQVENNCCTQELYRRSNFSSQQKDESDKKDVDIAKTLQEDKIQKAKDELLKSLNGTFISLDERTKFDSFIVQSNGSDQISIEYKNGRFGFQKIVPISFDGEKALKAEMSDENHCTLRIRYSYINAKKTFVLSLNPYGCEKTCGTVGSHSLSGCSGNYYIKE